MNNEKTECQGCLICADEFYELCQACKDKAADYDITKRQLSEVLAASKKAVNAMPDCRERRELIKAIVFCEAI